MQTSGTAFWVTTVLVLAGASACECDSDSVAPGYYGQMVAGSGSTSRAQPSASSMSSGAVGSASSPDTSTGRAAPDTPNAGGAAMAASAPSDPTPGNRGSGVAEVGTCDLSGRWLVTQHLVSDALGSLQYAHYFQYFEIEQHGDALSITKGLLCGYDSIGSGDFAATADFHAAWPGTLGKVGFKGRTGTSVRTSSGCKVNIEKWYTVRGATVPYYDDPNTVLPTVDQQATSTAPGWEDWDGDGNPGITGVVSGIVSGKIFVAPRMWTSMSGSVADVISTFRLPTQWNQEPNVMAYDGTPLLGSEAARAADATLHFAEFARLSTDQATGDDTAICNSVVELAPMLTPEAAGM